MKLIYGTYNPSKIESMEKMLDGMDPLTNAMQKALTYYRQIKKTVFSCDSGFRGINISDNKHLENGSIL